MALSRITYLFRQYESGEATDEEKAELLGWFNGQYNKETINEYFMQEMQKEQHAMDWNEEDWQPVIDKILAEEGGKVIVIGRKRALIRRMAVAAAILIVVLAGYWMFVKQPVAPGKEDTPVVTLPKDIQSPATNRAMITLADGKKVYLDSSANGTLAMQGNVQLVKLDDGQIAYQSQQLTANSQQLSYNTLSNPRGSKVIDMVLADGSHVWLNAGSSVTYPVAFVGNERKVSITGEAYFEVAHDAAKPFYVTKGDMEVKVLGTHFNVNAYDDEEEIKVTLLEGSVRATLRQAQGDKEVGPQGLPGRSKKYEVILKPGEQAQIREIRDSIRVIRGIHVIRDIDIEQVIAWKQGYFQMKGTDLQSLMRQIARWYDVQVVIEGKLPQKSFGGSISRDVNLSDMLKALEQYGVSSSLENGKVMIR